MARALEEKKPIRGAEAVAERPDGVRIPFIPFPTPLFDASGTLTGAVNMLVDITQRKQAEQALAERTTQLALAGKIALVGSFAFDIGSGRMQVSPGYAAIHGLPEGTVETRRIDWRTRVHPDDLPAAGRPPPASHCRPAARALLRVSHCPFRGRGSMDRVAQLDIVRPRRRRATHRRRQHRCHGPQADGGRAKGERSSLGGCIGSRPSDGLRMGCRHAPDRSAATMPRISLDASKAWPPVAAQRFPPASPSR